MKKSENNILLFSITLCWASSYIFIKNLPEDFSSFAYLTMTTGIAAAVMAVIFRKQLLELRKKVWVKGFLLSVLLSLNLLAEKKGLTLLPSTEAGFLSALTIVMVPLLLLFYRTRPTRNHAAGSAVILLGLCVGTGFKAGSFLGRGSLYMLGACACSAVYTIAVDRYTKEENPLLLCIVQMFFTAGTGFVLWYLEDPGTFRSIVYTRELLSNIFVLAFFTKAYAYIALMFAQKYTDAVSVTVIASTEPVVTLALAVLLPAAYGGEKGLHLASVAGAVLIACGAVIAGLHFLDNFPQRNVNAGEELR